MRIYISGKITGTTDYMTRFGKADLILKGKGFDVVNPARVCSQLPDTLTHDEYMKICIPLLSLCDSIYIMTGYEDSVGAMMELEWAKKHGLKIFWGK